MPRALTRELIVSTARIVAADMTKRFGLARPRLALAGLNPHAGEGGAMGREEIDTIAPAIAELRAEGLDVVGPLPADTMFHAAARARYDVALTMYHDQGLIPAKTLAFDTGVNVTLGLALRAHLARPRHGLRHRRQRARQPDQPDRSFAAGGAPRAVSLAADGLPPLREVVAAHGLEAKRSLGQNFLFDLNLTGRIARAAGPLEGVVVVEIGPGPGGLTRALLAHGASKVIAIERDERCLAALAEIAAHWPGRLEIIAGDALALDAATLIEKAQGAPLRICANLPYNIATALLTRWLEAEPWPPFYDRLTLMFQREVALRIVATPAERADYGRLAVLAGWRARARLLFDIPPAAFTPPPKVTSSVVELIPRAAPEPCEARLLSAATQAAFGQRRKMLRQSLKSFAAAQGLDLAALLAAARLDPTRRAEEIDVAGFCGLARAAQALAGR